MKFQKNVVTQTLDSRKESQAIKEAEESLKTLLAKLAILQNEDVFKMVHNFTIKDYLHDREVFAKTCNEHANHIEKIVHDAGIAETVTGSVGIAAGATAIAGILLAPCSFGWSLGMTVGSLTGSVISAAGTITTHLVKDGIIKADEEAIKACLEKFENEEKVIAELFDSIQNSISRLHMLMKENKTVEQYIKDYPKLPKKVGYEISYKGHKLHSTHQATKFADSVANFIDTDFSAMQGMSIDKEMTEPTSLSVGSRFALTAGSTTTKLFGSLVSVAGIPGIGIWQIADAIKHINGSELADKYREFATEYSTQTENIKKTLDQMKEKISPEESQAMIKDYTEKIMKTLLSKLAILQNEDAFKMVHKFTIREYLHDREVFAKTCNEHANHIEKIEHNAGIADAADGGIGIAAGATAIAGILLAPYSFGWSLGMTVGSITGGVVSAAGTITTHLVKDNKIHADEEAIEACLKKFENEEKVIAELFDSIQNNISHLHNLMKENKNVKQYIKDYAKMFKNIGYNVAYKGYSVYTAQQSIRFANNMAELIQADFYAMQGIAEGMSAPGVSFFSKTILTAGTTTAKAFGGIMGAIGIGMSIWQVADAVKHINGSELAGKYRKFATEYSTQTESIKKTLDQMKEKM